MPQIYRKFVFLFVVLVALFAMSFGTQAASLPSGFTETRVADNLAKPTAMQFAPDGRLFIAQQDGALRVLLPNDTLLPTPFVTVATTPVGERGLLGIAFDPNFTANRYVYVYYTATTPNIHNRISRFTADAGNPNVAQAGSEVILFDLDPLSSATNHNGGAMHFGADGKLYVAVGENANPPYSQSFNNLLGKMLRLNKDGSIPTDNPYYGDGSVTGKNKAIWALGLRNPFTFDIKPGTNTLFINDVGQGAWEEINLGVAGANYGWPDTEGEGGTGGSTGFTGPVYTYANVGNDCAITGGVFYNPTTAQFGSDYVGDYFYSDYCGGWIKRYDPATDSVANFATGIALPVDLKVRSNGSLYYLARGGYGSSDGEVWRISSVSAQAPTVTEDPSNVTAPVGGSATFTCSATGSTPLNYQWQRNGSNISGATSNSYTLTSVSAADNGATFRCVVSNAYGSDTSASATLTVTSNQSPTGSITVPTLYSAGQTVNFSGTGTDPEDGTLPASAFSWEVVFHHDVHTHPVLSPPDIGNVTSGSFFASNRGHVETNVWYRVYLTVTDSGGLSHTSYKDIDPRIVNVTLQTNPAGLQLKLDGTPVTAPMTSSGVVGVIRSISASTQTVGGKTYVFASWSDGGAATHEIVTPTTNTTYTANFVEVKVTSFTLINADTDTDIGPLTEGMTLNLATLPTRNLNVRANTSPASVGSVRFGYDGNANYRLESGAPYALQSNAGSDYYPWTPTVGSHTVKATPYTASNGGGSTGAALTVNFNVVDAASQSVTSFTLVNADTDTDIRTIVNGETINYATLGTRNINIRVNTNPATVGSVKIGYDSNPNYRIENGRPYAVGANSGANYYAWTPGVGNHTLTATPYTAANTGGAAGTPLSISFTVTNGTSVAELLTDSGFESQTGAWAGRMKCEAQTFAEGEPTRVAASGNCAGLVKGKTALSQTVSGLAIASGQELVVSGWFKGQRAGGAKLTLIVTYADGQSEKVNFKLPKGNYPYTYAAHSFTAKAAVASVKVAVKGAKPQNKLYVDDLSLSVGNGVADSLPVPIEG